MSTTYEKLEWRHYAVFVDGQRGGEVAFVAGRSGWMWFAPALVQPDRSDGACPTRLQAVNALILNHQRSHPQPQSCRSQRLNGTTNGSDRRQEPDRRLG